MTMKFICIGTLLITALAHDLPAVVGLTHSSPRAKPVTPLPPIQSRRLALSSFTAATLALLAPTRTLADDGGAAKGKLQRYPSLRFIAALGEPTASSGSGAETWGLWRDDPGPRGVYLRDFDRRIGSNDNVAPAGWKFDSSDWWVEEHSLIMSTPEPLPRKSLDKDTNAIIPEKKYLVTGDREVTTVLTVGDDGSWALGKGSLYDVTHLPCRSAAYSGETCAPRSANSKDFPVKPGA